MTTDGAELRAARQALAARACAAHAVALQRYFKTGPGEYGEGDRFIGVRVPALRAVARSFRRLSLADATTLLCSAIHEERLLALVVLVEQFRRADPDTRAAIYRLYLDHLDRIDNWDLVDTSAPHIVGGWLHGGDRAPLRSLARSPDLWARRIAIMATFHDIRAGDFDATLEIAEMLVDDPEDLIHKAVGWMLREVGKRERAVAEGFLAEHAAHMPRTMLRYAIEKYPPSLRRRYLGVAAASRGLRTAG
ncbi:MAG: DNA alkylation repair protein [Burkholderiaceae bacterium]